MTPEELASLIRSTLLDAAAAGRISIDPALVPDPVTVERPRVREHGDWATNVAMQLGKKAGMAPREFAQILADDLAAADGIDSVEVAGPGFINIRLGAGAAGELARTIVEAGAQYGRNATLAGHSINLEYVSANPTGPVHLGGARWAAVGDSLSRLMAACGAAVTREYYFNDHGSQIDRFSQSLYARATGREVPEDGYGGQYIADIAEQVRADANAAGEPDPVTLPEAEAVEVFRSRGVELMFAEIKERLHSFRADFDVFFHEDSLHSSGAVADAIERLRERGEVFDEGGAVWLRTTTYGDDKDRVLIKSDGQAAYFAGDVAYYLNKRERGADAAIYALVRVSMDTQVDIDLDLLSSHSNDNPVYYVQYAHVRTCNVARNAAAHGVTRDAGFDPAVLDTEADEALLAALAQFPAQVAQATELREPHRIARYLESLAATYHAWYGQCRVTPRGDDPVESGHVARLWLNDAVTQVLRTGLGLLGVGAPERM